MKDPYLRKFKLRVSGFRNWLWGLLTFSVKYTQISHKLEIVDSLGKTHEIYRKYRKIHFIPFKKVYTFRFVVIVPIDFTPDHIVLYRMSPGSSAWIKKSVVTWPVLHGRHVLYDSFTWDEVKDNSDD